MRQASFALNTETNPGAGSAEPVDGGHDREARPADEQTPTFEEGFERVEELAQAAAKAAQQLGARARALQRAAKTGNISGLRGACERLSEASGAARQAVANAADAWPFDPEEEEAYLRDAYDQELIYEGKLIGLSILRQDAVLVVSPAIVRILPDKLAVRIERKQNANIRPSHLASVLRREQTKRPRFTSKQFVEALWKTYQDITEKGMEIYGTPESLRDIYDRLTRLPDIRREYSEQEFCRDLYLLDHSGVRQTRGGAAVAFSGSTGTRQSRKKPLQFVGPDGEVVKYYAISFTQLQRR